ncbi:UbiH/UbiF/VisC/COQ6 family ubiquinone biosynthesis hydroxylase [Porticoccus sp. Uisw_050_02]|jgi:2-octaprenylphenol hydroxylase|uniref:UbiH/UbiF/VisC/COQ6 family ubiquinone biosynthesis hydroxylase n=1 Tax=Porticoccus sp. Uisw_050_02 TaxID=3230978 RepID=UPI0039EC956A|tara:strand:- start:1781 stop:3013 length:1233 start_codon:yes stop_codon:yes gene_type:complete
MGDKEYDIVVAGAGMVGLIFASLLATRQHSDCVNLKIAILEAKPFKDTDIKAKFDPRVVALTESSRHLLEDIGVWSNIASQRVCPYQRMEIWESDGTGNIEFDCKDIRQSSLGHIVENRLIIKSILHRMEGLENVELLCPAMVVDVDQKSSSGHSEVTTIILSDGTAITTKLLVAADGGESKVRDLCGFQLREWNYGHHAIVTSVVTEKAHNFTARQRFLPDGPLAFLPLQAETGNSHHCSIVWSQKDSVAEKLMLLDDFAFCEALELAGSSCLGKITKVEKRSSFSLKQRHAIDYVMPGIALIGDAAHTIHPLAGQGVNLGIQDAIALVNEIENALYRKLSPGNFLALRRYQRSRKPHNLGMMAVMEGLKRLFEDQHLPMRLLRNDGMRLINKLGFIKNKIVKEAMGIL